MKSDENYAHLTLQLPEKNSTVISNSTSNNSISNSISNNNTICSVASIGTYHDHTSDIQFIQ